jgi:hypothetical protein
VGIPADHPCIAQALERGLITREALGLPPLSPPAPPTSRSRHAAVATSEPGRWAITLTLPCRVVSEANERCHWAVRRRRFQEQAAALRAAWNASPLATITAWEPLLPFDVTFTRIGKRKLDTDNLSGAFKGLRDSLADLFGIDDGNEAIVWDYDQRTGREYGVVVTIGEKHRGHAEPSRN